MRTSASPLAPVLGLGAALLLGCASGTPPEAVPMAGVADAADVAPDRLVLATFARTHEEFWRPLVLGLAERHRLRPLYAWPMESLDEICVVFEVLPGREPEDAVAFLAGNGNVRTASVVQRFRTLSEGAWNDAYADLQHGLTDMGVSAAHRFATGRGVKIAVVDTGVDLAHPDLEGRVRVARNFVPRGEESFTSDAHGTAVAGVIAASANNRIGVVGVAPESELLALKACWPDPPQSRQATCDSYTLARALDFAIQSGARVLNLSLAGPRDALLERLLARAEERGLLAVTALDESGGAPFPASVASVVAVRAAPSPPPGASALPAGEPAAPDIPGVVAAPGTDILTTGPRGSYDFYSGSSLAAAHVSGVAALLLERRPDLAVAALRDLLRRAETRTAGHAGLSACSALGGALETDVCGAEAAAQARASGR